MNHKDNDVVKEIHVLAILKDVDGICTETDPIWYVPELFVRGNCTLVRHLIDIGALQKVPYTIRYQTERTPINTVHITKERRTNYE